MVSIRPPEESLQFQRPVLAQEQKLKMNPQLYQSIQLMALPVQDLKFRIQEELEQNPALEVMEDRSTVSLEEEDPKRQDEEYEYFEDTSDPGYTRSGSSGDDDSKRMFLEGALSRPETLHDHLLWQLRLQPIPADWFTVGELLILNLDDNGFHRDDPLQVAPERQRDIVPPVMDLIRRFEPPGTCTADYKESLVVQASLRPDSPPRLEELITKHMEPLERGKYGEVAKRMRLSEDEVHQLVDYMRRLHPFPGRLYSTESSRYVVPDLLVKLKDGEFVLVLNDEEIPVLGISPFFTQLVEEKPKKRELKSYVNTNVKNAKWFIRSIQQRNQTLVKVARAIVEFQRDFFMKGPKYLVPLTLKDIANEVGVHEATVSRITTEKYVQTEWGIFELKYFFSNSISGAGSTGSRYSKEGVKQIIREIIEEEGQGKHLSDQKISDLLKKRGINLARRTVAKYRKELDIMSSYDRR
jgi:RNA polymerase sigma-54 factor